MKQAETSNEIPVIKDYEILSKIGQGGIAEIFKARQSSLDRQVAIKVLFPHFTGDTDIVKRFEREATIIANLNHPNIVHVIDRGEADGRFYFVMEYVDGMSFKEIINSTDYAVNDKLDILIMVLKGLDYAHKNGVIHRDIKPANILIDGQGNALIADFGIAQIPRKSELENTRSDVVMGTLAYMSPEQRESTAAVDRTTDIYAVGIMLYEILVGRRPVGRFKMPSEINPKLSRRYDEIVSRCLAANPGDRYQTAVELKDELLNLISGRARGGTVPRQEVSGAEAFVGKCRFLDNIKETRFSSTMLVENKENHDLYVIKKHEKSSAGLKEARTLSGLKHKNIVNVLGAGGDTRRLVVMMEYAPGGSLADRMAKTFSCDKALEIAVGIIEGLDFAHKNGIVHGNLRPSNILFTRDEQVKIGDFGQQPHYNMMEKNWYSPPERRPSRQGDIYAFGVILYQMIFGQNPIYDRAGNLFMSLKQTLVPVVVQNILKKTLAIRVANRYHTAEELLLDLEDARDRLNRPRAALAAAPGDARDGNKKNLVPIVAISAVVIVAVIILIIILK